MFSTLKYAFYKKSSNLNIKINKLKYLKSIYLFPFSYQNLMDLDRLGGLDKGF